VKPLLRKKWRRSSSPFSALASAVSKNARDEGKTTPGPLNKSRVPSQTERWQLDSADVQRFCLRGDRQRMGTVDHRIAPSRPAC